MFRHCGPGWRSSYGRSYGFLDGMGYGWPDQFGRRWVGRGSPWGGLLSTAIAVALVAFAISWWSGRRQSYPS